MIVMEGVGIVFVGVGVCVIDKLGVGTVGVGVVQIPGRESETTICFVHMASPQLRDIS